MDYAEPDDGAGDPFPAHAAGSGARDEAFRIGARVGWTGLPLYRSGNKWTPP
jgi:hypothetical protein